MNQIETLILNGLATGGDEAKHCCLSHGLDRECFEGEDAQLFFDAVQKLGAESRPITSASITSMLKTLGMKKKDAEQACGVVYSCEDAVGEDEFERLVSETVNERLHRLELESYMCYSELNDDTSTKELTEMHGKARDVAAQKAKYTITVDNIDHIIDECKDKAERARSGEKPLPAIPMKWVKGFDDNFYDVQKDEYIVVAARSGVGKSSFATTVENDLLDNGKSFFKGTFEMSIGELASVLAGQRSKTNPRKIESEYEGKVDRYYQELERLREWYREGRIGFSHSDQIDMFINDYERFKLDKGKPDCVIVDYLQLMKCSPESLKLGRNYQLADISRRLKRITIEDGIPVIALVQLNVEFQREGRQPSKRDIKDCKDIESDANRVWILHLPQCDSNGYEQDGKPEKEIVWIQDKCRSGPWFKQWINFNGAQRRFYDHKLQQ